ncbi:hypothetical protein GYH30_055097 [Glycine max]|uniref:Uncharacterized protein n=1 Tax=Glycine max TaxID=3847 RepID=A0A0R0E835_SOYBN|nr:hypothetical protein GYH30_055097 [Glycine max]
MELDSIDEETTLLTLIEGVLVANIFYWGSRACVDLYHIGTIIEIYRISRNKMQRPWRVDDFDAFKQRMLGTGDKKPPPHRRALLFVDNAEKKIYVGAYDSNDVVGHAFNGDRCRCNNVPDLKSLRFNVIADVDNVFEGEAATSAVKSSSSQELRPSKKVFRDRRRLAGVYDDVAFKDGCAPSLNTDKD